MEHIQGIEAEEDRNEDIPATLDWYFFGIALADKAGAFST